MNAFGWYFWTSPELAMQVEFTYWVHEVVSFFLTMNKFKWLIGKEGKKLYL